MKGSRALLGAVATVAAAAAPAAAAPEPHPYGLNDGRGFRNILPPGSNGLANTLEGPAFLATGARPPHNNDQLRMYADLVYASPGLKAADIPRYFKDATFGVRPGDVESTISPRGDAVIQRDRGFGVPNITASTRSGALYATGYATGQDRLFMVDVLRNVGRARLASFAGGSRGNRQLDRDQWDIAPYTETDLQRQVDQFDDLYGADGARIQQDIRDYVAGLNAYAAEARANPLRLPFEYAAIAKPLEDFKATDVVAIASLVGGIFGKGGGGELDSALVLQDARKRFGARRGTRVWRDFRQASDPEHDVTIKTRRVRYLQPDRRRAKGAAALPDRGSVVKTPVAPPVPAAPRPSARRGSLEDLGALLRLPESTSNALVVSARESASGKPIAVFGPQVSYFQPQILMEHSVQAPGLSARGASFPGTNLYVQLGRGRDYAWSATSSGQDNTDTFAVPLCEPGGGRPTTRSMYYLYRGACRPIEVLERSNSWSPTPGDMTPAGSETLRAERTALGLVTARATVRGRPVAYTKLRSTYFHEVDSALGFEMLNDPARIRSYRDFNNAIYKIGYTFHWFYADYRDIAMFDSGAIPLRAKGVSRDVPTTGNDRFDWPGYDPATGLAAYEPARRHPQAVNERFFTNWNNGASRGYYSSDRELGYGSVHRVRTLTERVRSRIKGPKKVDAAGLIDAMEEAGTADVRGNFVARWLTRMVGTKTNDETVNEAVAKLRDWARSGGHRRDLNRDGKYEHAEAVKIMDAWWPKLIPAIYRPVLGDQLYDRLSAFYKIEDTPNDNGNRTNSHATRGWYSYVHKDMRTLLGKRVKGRYSRTYCGGANALRRVRGKTRRIRAKRRRVLLRRARVRCRKVLVRTLREAIDVDAIELYKDPRCKEPGDQVCFDAVYFRPLGGVTQPLIPWINRPTFQQVVEVQGPAPR